MTTEESTRWVAMIALVLLCAGATFYFGMKRQTNIPIRIALPGTQVEENKYQNQAR